jgi:uncharacterized membrane protein
VTTTETSTLPWSFRFAEATRAPLLLVGLGAVVAYLGFFVLFHNATGGLDGLRMEGRPLWLNPFGVVAFGYAGILGYMAVAVSYVLRFASARLRDLRPVLRLSPSEIADFDSGLRRIEPWTLRLMGIVGVVLVVIMDSWAFGNAPPDSRIQPWGWWVAFFAANDCVLAWIFFRMMTVLFTIGLRFSRLGERHALINLFDFRGIQPFTWLGLRLALLILTLCAITMPFVLVFTPVFGVEVMLITYGFTVVGIPVVIGAILVILPLHGIHRAIVRHKTSDLERVRAEIAREREAIAASDEERKTLATQRLPGLLAYEARVERVREWSLDFPAFLRFVLYVLIPLGSWIAAAFVERALGLALE